MAIDPITEDLITLHEAAGLYPRNPRGKFPHISQIYRHTTNGVRGVRLEWIQCGSKRSTSRQAVARFFERLTEAANPAYRAPAAAPTTDHAIVESQLDALGI